MVQPYTVLTYPNVSTEKNVLANIRAAALAGGWVVDKDSVDDAGELYLHSTANGRQNLYFSLKLHAAGDTPARQHLLVHGNTGFNASAAWDAQPGRFTERIRVGARGANDQAVWFYNYNASDKGSLYDGSSLAWWIVPPVAEQLVFVSPTAIVTVLRVVQTRNDGTLFSGWVPLFFGAADAFADASSQDAEGNMVWSAAWGLCASLGSSLSGLHVVPNGTTTSQRCCCTTTGVLYGGKNVDCLPPLSGSNPYYRSAKPEHVVRTSVFATSVGGTISGMVGAEAEQDSGTCTFSYKALLAPHVPVYDAAVVHNQGTLRHMLIKPVLYVCSRDTNTMTTVGELPYYAVNMDGLKAKDTLTIGSRSFKVLPLMHDSDALGIAFEVAQA